MQDILLAIEGGLLIGCMLALATIAVAYAAVEAFRTFRIWRSKRKCVALSLLSVITLYIGANKPVSVSVSWDDGLRDNGTEVSTNDIRMITFRWAYESWIPDVATLSLSYITIAFPENEPVLIGQCPITNMEMTVVMQGDATNYLYYAEQSYIPDAPVMTNGVYHIKCFGGENIWIPQGLKIYGDGNAILPPRLPEGESYLYDLMERER